MLQRNLRERARLVAQASRQKRDREAVVAPERVLAVLANVREAAMTAGLSADEIEARYRALVAEFIDWEARCFERAVGADGSDAALSLDEIRIAIDAIDREIVACLAAPGAALVRTECTGDATLDALVARVITILCA